MPPALPPTGRAIPSGGDMSRTNHLHLSTGISKLMADARKISLKNRYIAARRWHTDAIRALDACWLAAAAKASKAKPHERLAIWEALESELAGYFAGVPTE